jgi:hypothetical protein
MGSLVVWRGHAVWREESVLIRPFSTRRIWVWLSARSIEQTAGAVVGVVYATDAALVVPPNEKLT